MARSSWALPLLAALWLMYVPTATAGPTSAGEGSTTSGTLTFDGGEYNYLLHTPASYDADGPAPLVVVVHGCQTTAEQQMRSSLFNEVAQRERFVVLYVDVDQLGRLQPGPANQCWKFPYPPAWTRDNSDAGAIAEMTRTAIAERNIDPERVYLLGMSAGGLMVSIDAAASPDLFAAVGIIASAGYVDWPCFTTGVGIPVEQSAELAYREMGPRARIVPRIVMGGTADAAFPPNCVKKALEQGLRTSNLVLTGTQTAPISLEPASVRDGRVPGGYAYTVSSFLDPDGCLIGERWIIDGLAHAWPGGSTDPQYNNDTKAPDAAAVFWAFLERYWLSDTSMPCATGRLPTPASGASQDWPTGSAPETVGDPSAAPNPSEPRAAAPAHLPTTGRTSTLRLALVAAVLGLAGRRFAASPAAGCRRAIRARARRAW